MESQNQWRGSESTVRASANIVRTVFTLQVATDVTYYHIQYNVELLEDVPESLRHHFKPMSVSGFAANKDVSDFLSDGASEIKPIPQMRIAPVGFREVARCEMFSEAFTKYQSAFSANVDDYEAVRSGSVDLDDIVRIDIGSHMLFDRHGDVLPIAIAFSFLHGGMHSGRHDLDKALEILLKDERVRPVKSARQQGEPVLSVTRVADHYSTDDYSQRHINFIFAPTAEDMRAIWEKCKSYGTEYPSTRKHEAIFDLDLLGLRACGAAKYPTFWGEDSSSEEE